MLTGFRHNLSQIIGWKTSRQLVVIESDDWGAIRMPDRETYHSLLNGGIRVDKCLFSRYDTLEKKEDLDLLYNLLGSVKGKDGSTPIFTQNYVVANPDFEKIRECDFSEYLYKTIDSHYDEMTMGTLLKGMENKYCKPQFHGREHLNVLRWLEALNQGDEMTRLSFDQGHFSLTKDASPRVVSRYMDAFGNVSAESLAYEMNTIVDGMKIFERVFGFRSRSFIAPCYIWRPELEVCLKQEGIDFLQGLAFQQIPVSDAPFRVKLKYHYTGQHNRLNQRYLVRNAFFEPYKDEKDWVDDCLSRVSTAFRWHAPAIISSHRINYVGLDPQKRGRNMRQLDRLLKAIVMKWPRVEFITSDVLGEMMNHG